MAHITEPRVLETSATTGTGAITLAGAVSGYQAFSDVCTSPSDTVFYYIEEVDGSGVPNGQWEEGFGTYSAANTLTRTTVLNVSPGAANPVSFTGGALRVALTFPAFRAAGCDVQVFTTPGSNTWTNPSPSIAKPVRVRIVPPGNGGGSGRKGAAGASAGGGGGPPGPKIEVWLNSDDLGATETAFVGAGGAGGAAQTANGTNGNPGATAGDTYFGASTSDYRAAVFGVALANGGNTSTTTVGAAKNGYPVNAASIGAYGTPAPSGAGRNIGGNAGASTAAGVKQATCGGGGGGATGASYVNGGAGGGWTVGAASSASSTPAVPGAAGGVGSTATPPQAGFTPDDPWDGGGGGGGGGYTGATTTPQAGANGGYPGGGGGGGSGGLDSVTDSGAGGDGGDGWIEVTTFL